MKAYGRPLLAVLLIGLLLVASFRLDTREQDLGYSREARLNPWLAAGRVLEQSGLRVEYAPDYSRLPARADLIVLATPLAYLDYAEQKRLLDWVRAGGHLVTGLQDGGEGAAAGLLQRTLEVRLREREFSAEERQTLQPQPRLRPVQLDRDGTVQARFLPQYTLESGRQAPQWRVRDAFGDHALRFGLGAGRVTLLSDLAWLDNPRLGQGDHAALLWATLAARSGDRVWLIHGSERPALLTLLWETAAPFLMTLLVLLLVWLWAASRRFGPVHSVLHAPQRRLAEHLEASGRYLLHAGGLPRLYAASRQRLLGQLQRRHPQWRRLPPAELAQRLGARAGIEPAAVQRVLSADAPSQLLQFAADLRLINRLRKAL